MSAGNFPAWSQTERLRVLIPVFAAGTAVLAAVADPSSGGDLVLCALAAAPFLIRARVGRVPLLALSLAVIVPAVVAQRSARAALVRDQPALLRDRAMRPVDRRVGRPGRAGVARPRGRDPHPGSAGHVDGDLDARNRLPWAFGRAAARQAGLVAQLEASRREPARQALLVERPRVARDVHDLVGHALAAVILQVTSARHVLRRDPRPPRRRCAPPRRSAGAARASCAGPSRPPQPMTSPAGATGPSASEIPALVEHARAGGLAVELRLRGDRSAVAAGVGVALYRIAQEALANAARHAPRARTLLALEVGGARARLAAETTGPTAAASAGEPEADRDARARVGARRRADRRWRAGS